MFPTPPFPFAGLLPALTSVPNYHSNPITQRVRRQRQRLPPSLLIENASDIFLAFQRTACPRRFRSRLLTIRKLRRNGPNRNTESDHFHDLHVSPGTDSRRARLSTARFHDFQLEVSVCAQVQPQVVWAERDPGESGHQSCNILPTALDYNP